MSKWCLLVGGRINYHSAQRTVAQALLLFITPNYRSKYDG